jgi:hypothetical protein
MSNLGKDSQEPVFEDQEPRDDDYAKIVSQIEDEERLWSLWNELKEFARDMVIPLIEDLNPEDVSDFLTPSRVRVF